MTREEGVEVSGSAVEGVGFLGGAVEGVGFLGGAVKGVELFGRAFAEWFGETVAAFLGATKEARASVSPSDPRFFAVTGFDVGMFPSRETS